MLVEIVLLGCGGAVVAALAAYNLAGFAARRNAGRQDRDAPATTVPAADAPALIGASGQGSGSRSTQAVPLDAWVDDALRRELDAL
jgi:hypothetical protein